MNSSAIDSKFTFSTRSLWMLQIAMSLNLCCVIVDLRKVLSLLSAEKDLSAVHDGTGMMNKILMNFVNSGNSERRGNKCGS